MLLPTRSQTRLGYRTSRQTRTSRGDRSREPAAVGARRPAFRPGRSGAMHGEGPGSQDWKKPWAAAPRACTPARGTHGQCVIFSIRMSSSSVGAPWIQRILVVADVPLIGRQLLAGRQRVGLQLEGLVKSCGGGGGVVGRHWPGCAQHGGGWLRPGTSGVGRRTGVGARHSRGRALGGAVWWACCCYLCFAVCCSAVCRHQENEATRFGVAPTMSDGGRTSSKGQRAAQHGDDAASPATTRPQSLGQSNLSLRRLVPHTRQTRRRT
jgi:hypothetical protein